MTDSVPIIMIHYGPAAIGAAVFRSYKPSAVVLPFNPDNFTDSSPEYRTPRPPL